MTEPGRPRRRLPGLRDGFASITLDPTPWLRAARERLRERDRVAEAWANVAQALSDAIRQAGRS